MPCTEPALGGCGNWEGHSHGPKGLGPIAPENSVRDAQQPPRFRTPNDIVRYTTEELLDITAHHATNKEAVGPLLVPSGRETVPSSNRAVSSMKDANSSTSPSLSTYIVMLLALD
jgi:hypothetical protein